MKTLTFIASILAALTFSGINAQEHAPKPAASAGAQKKYKDINPDRFDKMRQSDTNAVVLDVRTKKEYQEGHIPGSVLIDFNSPDFAQKIATLDTNKTYLVHCAAGGRSARACKKMDQMNFSKLYNLEGGMTAWEKAGKPIEK